jgi:hypothetical protein
MYFDFDRYDLSSDARTTLRANADWLKNNPAARVEIEATAMIAAQTNTTWRLALNARARELTTLGIAAARDCQRLVTVRRSGLQGTTRVLLETKPASALRNYSKAVRLLSWEPR